MDRSDIAWLSRVQQDLDNTAMKIEWIAKRYQELTEKMQRILEKYEKEISASNLRR